MYNFRWYTTTNGLVILKLRMRGNAAALLSPSGTMTRKKERKE